MESKYLLLTVLYIRFSFPVLADNNIDYQGEFDLEVARDYLNCVCFAKFHSVIAFKNCAPHFQPMEEVREIPFVSSSGLFPHLD